MSTVKWSRAALAIVTLITFLSVTSACYGPFNLTRTLYKWNGQLKGTKDMSDKWVRELVFLGMVLLPVYEFSLIIDGLVLNSIEFWGGQNPIKATQDDQHGGTRVVHAGETTVTMIIAEDGASAHVIYEKAGQVFKTGEIVQARNSYRFVDENGRAAYSAEMSEDGGLNIVDGECRLIDFVSSEQLLQATNRLATMQSESN